MQKVRPEAFCKVLLVGEDAQILEQTKALLLEAGIVPVLELSDSCSTLSFLEQHDVSLIVLDMTYSMYKSNILSLISESYPDIPIIVETALNDVEIAVNCMKFGAVDYMIRPLEPGRLIAAAENSVNFNYSNQEAQSLKKYLLNDRLEHAEAFVNIKTTCKKMRLIFQYTEIIARSSQAVLITGDTGVGKELFAQAIHQISAVKGQLVNINVAGLDDNMFSDTLFGHKKGAFTGADQYRDGLVSKAAMGTLFLDEIGDLNELSQVKLLRLLQEKEYYPVGADQLKTSSARIVLATNVNLQERIKAGRFRRDLYYRLSTHQVHIPALSERLDDLPLLLETFIEEAARHFRKKIPSVSPILIKNLSEYAFPGNIRELRAKVYDAVARHEGQILTINDFNGIPFVSKQDSFIPVAAPSGTEVGIYGIFGRLPTFREIEDYLILEALKLSDGNYAVAASILGVTRQTISKRLKSVENTSLTQ